MKRILTSLFFVILCLVVGYISGLMQAASLETWYPFITKSPITPPAAVFPVVWTILYILMGIVAGILWSRNSIYSRLLFTLFFAQLLFNPLWTFCFFYMQSPLLGFVVIMVLDMLALMYIAGCFVVSKLCGWLTMPYILWLLFATYLNGYIALMN